MREHNDIAQWEDGIDVEGPGDDGFMLVGHGYPELREPAFPSAPNFLSLQPFDETGRGKNERAPIPQGQESFDSTQGRWRAPQRERINNP
jgi:hypothetical protein